MSVEVKEYMPTVALQPYVLRYWEGYFLGSPTDVLELKVMPSSYMEVMLHLSDGICEIRAGSGWQKSAIFSLTGLRTSPFVVQFRAKVDTFNIRFKPDGIYSIFGVPASEFINSSANLEDVFGPTFSSFCNQVEELKTVDERIRLTDQYLLKRLQVARAQLSRVQRAAELIRRQKGEITVDSLSSEVCISRRQLEREFKSSLGMSPKAYMRIARLNNVMQLINKNPSISLAQLSYLCGYADQAHFVRDFKLLTGELPSVYVSELDNFMVP